MKNKVVRAYYSGPPRCRHCSRQKTLRAAIWHACRSSQSIDLLVEKFDKHSRHTVRSALTALVEQRLVFEVRPGFYVQTVMSKAPHLYGLKRASHG